MVPARSSATGAHADGGELEFDRYGEDYFPSAIGIAGDRSGQGVVPFPADANLQAQRAAMEMAVVRPAR
jgi:hypothetical protein